MSTLRSKKYRTARRSLFAHPPTFAQSHVVLDIGAVYTKCGFIGEGKPRHIFPTDLRHGEARLIPKGNDFPEGETLPRGALGSICFSRYAWVQILLPFLQEVFQRYLHVNPKERPVLICDNPFWSNNFRVALAQVLFDLKCPGLYMAPMLTLPIYCSGETSGLMIDVGYSQARTLLISNGHPLKEGLRASPIGMKDLISYLKYLLINASHLTSDFTSFDSLPDEILEDVVVRTCYVSPIPPNEISDEKKNDNIKDVGDIIYDSHGISFTVDKNVRREVGEALYEQNEQESHLSDFVLDTLLKCPRDSRARVCQNVILSGGTTMVPGFAERLFRQMNSSILNNSAYSSLKGLHKKIKLAKLQFQNNCCVFIGGSILGSLELHSLFLTSDQFDENLMNLCDWTRAALPPNNLIK